MTTDNVIIKRKIKPFPWLTPLYIHALKIYQFTFGRLPHGSLQITISSDNIPSMLLPKVSVATIVFLVLNICQQIFGGYMVLQTILSRGTRRQSSLKLVQVGTSIGWLNWSL